MKVSASEAGTLLRRRAQAVDREVRAAEKDALDYAVKTARRLSSGTFTSAMLRALGHPYARRAPNPPANPAIINLQSGQFQAGWQTEGPRKQGAGLVSKLTNSSRVARYLFAGTRLMIARPILEAIRARVADYRYRKVQDAVRRALKNG